MPPLNKNNSAVKRIMQEARELANDPSTDYSAAPLEDDIFEWHCTLRGSPGTEFEGGLYHFRILLPAEYPFRPPSIMMLTPNGRFELNTKICISFTNYHEELWQPAWGVRTAIVGLQGFFPLKGQAAVGVGSIEYPAPERRRLAALSRSWHCPVCEKTNLELLPDPEDPPSEPAPTTTNPDHKADSPAPPPDVATLGPCVAEEKPATDPAAPMTSTTETRLKEVTPPSNPIAPEEAPAVSSSTSTTPVSPHPISQRNPTTVVQSRSSIPIAQRSDLKPPAILDATICILLVLVFAILCRRLV